MLKTTRNKKENHIKIIMMARSKLNSIESEISVRLINSEISHEEFMTFINEETEYQQLNKSFRIVNSQRSDTENNNLIEEGKK